MQQSHRNKYIFRNVGRYVSFVRFVPLEERKKKQKVCGLMINTRCTYMVSHFRKVLYLVHMSSIALSDKYFSGNAFKILIVCK